MAVWPAIDPYMSAAAREGRRLAAEALPKTHSVTANKVRKTICKRIAAHVLLPRAQGSMRFKFKIVRTGSRRWRRRRG